MSSVSQLVCLLQRCFSSPIGHDSRCFPGLGLMLSICVCAWVWVCVCVRACVRWECVCMFNEGYTATKMTIDSFPTVIRTGDPIRSVYTEQSPHGCLFKRFISLDMHAQMYRYVHFTYTHTHTRAVLLRARTHARAHTCTCCVQLFCF